jgi:hypothetical protein
MIGTTGTCYYRAKNCWKGMLILELARGGWVNVYHGNLELLNDTDGKWFAKVQRLYHGLQKQDSTEFFGSIPGKGLPYGFKSTDAKGTVCTVVNPSQEMATIELPVGIGPSKILYADGGYKPVLSGKTVKAGPEQLVVIGLGEYANEKYDMGTDDTIHIPVAIDKIPATFANTGKDTIGAKVDVPAGKNLRIVMQQYYSNGDPCRSWLGAPPDGKKVNEVIKIQVTQDGREIPQHIEYDKMIWSGLSWGVAEIRQGTFDHNKPLTVQCSTSEKDAAKITGAAYAVTYA